MRCGFGVVGEEEGEVVGRCDNVFVSRVIGIPEVEVVVRAVRDG